MIVSCPACATQFGLDVLFQSQADHDAYTRLVALASPLHARLVQYLQLHKPAKQQLTAAKSTRLLAQLLPDLERGAITWKGRDWPAPLRAWQVAIDQLLSKRNAATLELPLTGHGYLYAVLAGMADKQEAAAELEREQAARARAHSSAAPTAVGDVLTVQQALGAGIQPMSFAPAPAPAQQAGTSPTVRAMRAAIERKKGEQP